MICWIVAGTLAAFGLLSALWCLFGWLLPRGSGVMVCAPEEQAFIRRYQWLREMGLIRCPLLIVDRAEISRLEQLGAEVWSRETQEARQRTGEKDVDGTGTGDPAGRNQRCCISEL